MIDGSYLKKFEGGKTLIEFYGKKKQQLIRGKIEKVVIECLGLRIFVSEIMIYEKGLGGSKKWIKNSLKPKDFYYINFETSDLIEKDNSLLVESYQQGIDVTLYLP